MSKTIITEIERTRKLMGLLVENPIPIRVTKDVGEELVSKFGSKFASTFKRVSQTTLDDINLLKKISAGEIYATQNEMRDLILRLINSNKNIEKYLVPKIIENSGVASKNFIANLKTSIKNAKETRGVKYQDIIRGINSNLNATRNGVPVFDTSIPQVKDYVKKDLERYAWELYNPTQATLKKTGMNAVKGAKSGISSKSGSKIFVREFGKKITPKTVENSFPSYFKKITEEERKKLWYWITVGIPDVPSIQAAWKNFGFVGGLTNFSVQLLKKWFFLTIIVTFSRAFLQYVKDFIKDGEEYPNMTNSKIFWERLRRAFYIPHFGFTSPAIWLAGLIFKPIISGLSGERKNFWESAKNYIIGEDPYTIPKLPKDLNSKEVFETLRTTTDTLIKDTELKMEQLKSGNDVDTSNLIPDSMLTTTPIKDLSIDSIPQPKTDTTTSSTIDKREKIDW